MIRKEKYLKVHFQVGCLLIGRNFPHLVYTLELSILRHLRYFPVIIRISIHIHRTEPIFVPNLHPPFVGDTN
jgi:hypothetical protein